MNEGPDITRLLAEVRACRACALEHEPRPVLQFAPRARILIAGQAPGRRADASGIPFADPSGERLLDWLGLDREVFHDPNRVTILPMAFCYPGAGPAGGDLPPRRECAEIWRHGLLERLVELRLTILLGSHAIAWHLPHERRSLTAIVRDGSTSTSSLVPLPHPSPRNNPWLKRNPWFERELLPRLRERVRGAFA